MTDGDDTSEKGYKILTKKHACKSHYVNRIQNGI
jgi:hypothetical protein